MKLIRVNGLWIFTAPINGIPEQFTSYRSASETTQNYKRRLGGIQ